VNEHEMQLLIEGRRAVESGYGARLRELAGLSQDEIAALVGVSGAAISYWESGKRRPRQPQAIAYAKALREVARELARTPA
jgi:transcriptional regulator with XRE-family HTH domain